MTLMKMEPSLKTSNEIARRLQTGRESLT